MMHVQCPECRQGKPWNCDGTAWDNETDTVTTCSSEVVTTDARPNTEAR